MTLDEKVKLVALHRKKHGLNACLEAISLAKSTWYYRNQKRPDRDRVLKDKIVEVIRKHPDYGYRRLLPDVVRAMNEPVNHKRLRRVLQTYDLSLPRCLPKHRPSPIREILSKHRGQLDLVKGNTFGKMEAFSTDITLLHYDHGKRKAFLMAFVDIVTKYVAGWALSMHADRQLALSAWKQAKVKLDHLKCPIKGLIIHSDQDPIYTSYDWLKQVLLKDGAKVSYSERGCKDNPWIESFWGRLKVEIGSLISEAESYEELEQIIKERIQYYIKRRRHSSINNLTPLEFLHQNGEATALYLSQT